MRKYATQQDIQRMRNLAKTMKLEDVAKKTGFSESTVWRYCKGIRRPQKPKGLTCPRCSGQNILSSGISWKCKACGKTWVKKPKIKKPLKLSKEDAKFLASVINKNAYIGMHSTRNEPRIMISTVRKKFAKKLAKILEVNVSSSVLKSRKTNYAISVTRRDKCRVIAKATLPYLLGKQKQRMKKLLKAI